MMEVGGWVDKVRTCLMSSNEGIPPKILNIDN